MNEQELREKIANIAELMIEGIASCLSKSEAINPEKLSERLANQILALVKEWLKEAGGVKLAYWIDIPDKAGSYWMSAFCDGHYISPRIQEVIDYARPGRGLEVRYSPITIPVKKFVEEYRPKAKWLFISQPKAYSEQAGGK
jgi:hypothetical protein